MQWSHSFIPLRISKYKFLYYHHISKTIFFFVFSVKTFLSADGRSKWFMGMLTTLNSVRYRFILCRPSPSPRVYTEEGLSYGDVITNLSRLHGLPTFLTHGASLVHFMLWSSSINIAMIIFFCKRYDRVLLRSLTEYVQNNYSFQLGD